MKNYFIHYAELNLGGLLVVGPFTLSSLTFGLSKVMLIIDNIYSDAFSDALVINAPQIKNNTYKTIMIFTLYNSVNCKTVKLRYCLT